MALRYDRYRMSDGKTPLGAAYFNPVWQDIDVRIAALEALKIEWTEVVAELTRFGLERINVALAPTLDQASTLLGQLLNDAHGFRTALMEEIQPDLDKVAAPASIAATYADGRLTALTEQLPAGERVISYTYDDEGRVSTATSTFAGVERVETYAYVDGLFTGMAATQEAA